MRLHRPIAGGFLFLLPAIILVAMPGNASALGHRHHRPTTPPAGYAVPIQEVFQYPGTIVHQPTSPSGYAAPIQDVFQYPAAIVNQPGALLPPAVPGWVGADGPHAVHHR